MEGLRLHMDDYRDDPEMERDTLPFPPGGVFGCRDDRGTASTGDFVLGILARIDGQMNSLKDQIEHAFSGRDDSDWRPFAA